MPEAVAAENGTKAPEPRHAREVCAKAGCTPHAPATREKVGRILANAMDNPTAKPGHNRLNNAVRQLETMATSDDHRAQPHAMAGYLEWWQGYPEQAVTHSLSALEHDESVSLAPIVVTMVGIERFPAYLG